MYIYNSLKSIFDTVKDKKILHVHKTVFTLLNKYFTQDDFLKYGILSVTTFGNKSNPFNMEIYEIYIFNEFISIDNIFHNFIDSNNKKIIYSIADESKFDPKHLLKNKDIIQLSYIDLSFVVLLPNLIFGITPINMKTFTNNAHLYNISNDDLQCINNISTTTHIIQLNNNDFEFYNEFIQWHYISLLYKYNIIEKYIPKSKIDPYFVDIWKMKYADVVSYFNKIREDLLITNITVINSTEISLKKTYLKIHLEMLNALDKIINENHLIELSEIENDFFCGNLTKTEALEKYLKINPTNIDKFATFITTYSKIKCPLSRTIHYSNLNRPSTLYSQVEKKISQYKIPSNHRIFLFVDKISFAEAIHCSLIPNLIIFQNNINMSSYMSLIGFNQNKYMCKKISYINQLDDDHIVNKKYEYYNKIIEDLILEIHINVFNDDIKIKDILMEISTFIKIEDSKLKSLIDSSNKIISSNANCDMQQLDTIKRKYLDLTNLIKKKYKKTQELNIYSNFDEITYGDAEQTETDLLLQDIDYEQLKLREIEIDNLHNDILNINEMSISLSLLLHEQGNTLDLIENNMINAHEHVEKGNDELKKANTYQKKSSKVLKGILITVASVGGIVGLVTGLALRK